MSTLILIVDDDPAARYGVRRVMEAEGHRTLEADSGERCLEMLTKEAPALVLLDVSMPGMGGTRCLEEIAARTPRPPVVMLTAFGNERLAVECLRKGAYDYLPKPYEIDELKAVVGRALEKVALEEENRALRAQLSTHVEKVSLGVSLPIVEIDRLIDRIAPSDVSVLVTGESGTGKELVARELHRRSARSGRAFIALNCAALPEDLVESELFGHEKGSFTGAHETRKGKFEAADGGSLFLDEVAEMTTRTQSKLLRVLQERSFERLGSNRTISVDVRLVAATNRDLRLQVERGAFREDLYYRLKVAEIRLPSLRQRPEDIAPLALQFLREASRRSGREVSGISDEALDVLRSARWPGNVRELKNAMEYAVVLCDGPIVQASMLPLDLNRTPPPSDSKGEGDPLLKLGYAEARREAIVRFERAYVEKHLRLAHGNVSEAARSIGIARQSLQAKLKELDLDPARFRLRDAPGDERS